MSNALRGTRVISPDLRDVIVEHAQHMVLKSDILIVQKQLLVERACQCF